ncbi:hypothetical protein [Fusobacterium sp. HC1336]|uniref:hypothetical protein n=1 Tax=Fusobacterium sp. HC1336 TaxID=3171169 RepID=UPI003F278781
MDKLEREVLEEFKEKIRKDGFFYEDDLLKKCLELKNNNRDRAFKLKRSVEWIISQYYDLNKVIKTK